MGVQTNNKRYEELLIALDCEGWIFTPYELVFERHIYIWIANKEKGISVKFGKRHLSLNAEKRSIIWNKCQKILKNIGVKLWEII